MENVYRPNLTEGVFKHPQNEELKISQKKNKWQKDREEVKESYLPKRDFGSS
jgi:hypothetical protein